MCVVMGYYSGITEQSWGLPVATNHPERGRKRGTRGKGNGEMRRGREAERVGGGIGRRVSLLFGATEGGEAW